MKWVELLLISLLGGVFAPLDSMAKGTGRPQGLSVPPPIASPTPAGSREANLAALPDGGWCGFRKLWLLISGYSGPLLDGAPVNPGTLEVPGTVRRAA